MSHHEDGVAPGETTSLLANGNGQQSSRAEAPEGWRHFFFNRRKTPGTQSENRMVRYSASTWHVTKVTLLSSEFSPFRCCAEGWLVVDTWRGRGFLVLTGCAMRV